MPDDPLRYASPEVETGGARRSLVKWIQLLLVWAIGLAMWGLYVIAIVYLLSLL